MTTLKYTVHLESDGEIGSGLGNEVVNNMVARDHRGQPVLRAAHLKGLLRQVLADIAAARGWGTGLTELCFGREGRSDQEGPGDDGVAAAVRVSDATTDRVDAVRSITRTRLTDLGVVHSHTLRTTEAVRTGTRFNGAIRLLPGAPPSVELAVRLGLLSLESVGGGRSRGSGACWVEVDGEQRSPGQLLEELDAVATQEVVKRDFEVVSSRPLAGGEAVFMQLVFEAADPVCCPETPVVSSNVIRAGLGIPASAVQGAIITRLAQVDPQLARGTLEDSRTRVWPLLPVPPTAQGLPVRVALSHRMSKLENAQGSFDFRDAAIEPYDWREASQGSPLKSSDGVLVREASAVHLWRGGDMPRIVTAHAVHHDPRGQGRRNLFTVEALAPGKFRGIVSLPPEAAEALQESLANDSEVSFGKARTVRGSGTLEVDRWDLEAALEGWSSVAFVLQSPALIPGEWRTDASAEERLAELVNLSGWGSVAPSKRHEGEAHIVTQASCGTRFGWNRHGLGRTVGRTRRLGAHRVFLPGSVFVLEAPPAAGSLRALLQRGLGVLENGDIAGRTLGFGSVLPHPGIASERARTRPELVCLKSDGAGKLALEWSRNAGKTGPSPAQIAAVADRIKGKDYLRAIEHLDRQRSGRSVRVWERWEKVFDDVRQQVQADPEKAKKALRSWQDLTIAQREN